MQSYARRAALTRFFACIVCAALLTFHVVAEPAVVADAARAAGKQMAFDAELERFKTDIDLRAFAASLSYELDPRASWAGSAVMRHANGDKIIITRNAQDGHYLYYSVRDDRDNGTIIDFLKFRRPSLTLGDIRKQLRPWLGPSARPLPLFAPLEKTHKDRRRVELAFAQTTEAHRHPYLERERGIPASLLVSRRFLGTVRIDARGNAVFGHVDKSGVCGMEMRNTAFKGFSKGGSKGLWLSHEYPDDKCLVLCESAIECLSHAALFPDDPFTRYASVAGKLNMSVQPELIRAAAARMPLHSAIIAAMNPDVAGRALATDVACAVQRSGRSDLRFEVREPDGPGDWNDQLRASRGSALPIRHGEPHVG